MFRFVHAADLHLDSPLKGLDVKEGAPRELIREAPRRALDRLVQLCLDERVDFLVLAGDVYDGDWKDNATGQYFADRMRRLGDLPVFMIRGNHDAANRVKHRLPLPRNVRVLGDGAAETAHLEPLRVAVHGYSFKDRETRENLVREYPDPVPGWYNLGLLHTSLAGADGAHDTYAPCGEDQLRNKGYDYWALGHVHQRRVVHPAAPAIVFPGNVQGRHVRETGEKGAYLVEVDGDRTALHFRRLDAVRWEVVEHAAGPGDDREGVLASALAAVRGIVEAEGDRLLVVRYRLVGPTKAHEALHARGRQTADEFREQLLNEYGDRVWLESVRFETSPPDLAAAGEPDDVAAELQAVVEEFAREPERMAAVGASLHAFAERLPVAVATGEEALRPSDPQWLANLLVRVRPLLNDAATAGGRP